MARTAPRLTPNRSAWRCWQLATLSKRSPDGMLIRGKARSGDVGVLVMLGCLTNDTSRLLEVWRAQARGIHSLRTVPVGPPHRRRTRVVARIHHRPLLRPCRPCRDHRRAPRWEDATAANPSLERIPCPGCRRSQTHAGPRWPCPCPSREPSLAPPHLEPRTTGGMYALAAGVAAAALAVALGAYWS
jgi:hypothetical protein